jgi:hypothetical protein
LFDAAADCSTSAAFWRVIASSAAIAAFAAPGSPPWARLTWVISCMMLAASCTEATTSRMVWPASPTLLHGILDQALISFAAPAERWARLRTSPATRAKPRPCSPARHCHRRVQGQDIGLEGDAVDQTDDLDQKFPLDCLKPRVCAQPCYS